jgi:uncharacterized protein
MPMITKKLISKVLDSYPLSTDGIHGISHWERVRENGLRLAELTGAHKPVVELFALFHDSQRINDGKDWKHGLRGAQFAETLKGNFFHLPENLFTLLYTACEKHTSNPTHEDITIQTCFDADRLDLGRVGITPDPALLCTDAAKQKNMIKWAYTNSINGCIYGNIDRTKKTSGTSNSILTQKNCFAVTWLHGTKQYFKRWMQPPIPTRFPKYLRPHSFVSLSSEVKYPNLHKGRKGGICSARLLATANVLDLRVRTRESLFLREKVLSTNLGSTNYNGIKTPQGWFEACNTGLVLRYVVHNKNDHKELFKKLKIASSTSVDSKSRFEADMYVHNFNRNWTELVIGTARGMGYDAVICKELGREVNEEPSTQLFVFNTDFLSPPVWIEYPHTNNITDHIPVNRTKQVTKLGR